jgi:tetratricopeptide (TPR) repeat protein
MKIRSILKFPIQVCLAILATGALPANADNPLAMTTVGFDVPGTAEVLDGDYRAAIKASEQYVDAGYNLRKVAARTNLCIAYTGLGEYEDAAKWCGAAKEINRSGWITANNEAVLHILKGEIQQGHEMLESAEERVNNGAFRKSCRECWVAIKENHEEAERREVIARASSESEAYVARSDK